MLALWAASFALPFQAPPPAASYPVTPEQLAGLRSELAPLEAKLKPLVGKYGYADAAIYAKAVNWLLDHPEEFYGKEYLTYARAAITQGLKRAASLEPRQTPITEVPLSAKRGRVSRAYLSRVDGSLQPYRLTIPLFYDSTKPVRLDVILHGRNAKLTEASFLAFEGKADRPVPEGQDWIEVEVYGRGNNAYRWSGETDLFEVLDAVQAEYKIDPDRILLRGFSMGGAGAWHVGLHHPSRWAGVEAGAGFTETITYAKQDKLPPHVRAMLHIYDAVDYSRNIALTPFIGYGGEIDKQLQASLNIKKALADEAVDFGVLKAQWLVGPQTEHKWHPESKKESEAFLTRNLPRTAPAQWMFRTYTPRFGNGPTLSITALQKLYEKAEIQVDQKTTPWTVKTTNVRELTANGDKPVTLLIDGQRLTGREFAVIGDKWVAGKLSGIVKRAGLQGPIDDAFMERFTVVGHNDDPLFRAFAQTWHKYFRGQLTAQSTWSPSQKGALVLFGTPETNSILARLLPRLPVKWNEKTIVFAGKTFDSATHRLQMIYPNPAAPTQYVVINSGHTFTTKDLDGTNALLFPRLGDFAIIETATGRVKLSGHFDANWQLGPTAQIVSAE